MVSTIAQSENISGSFVNDLKQSRTDYKGIVDLAKYVCKTEDAFLFVKNGGDTYYLGAEAADVNPHYYTLPIIDEVYQANGLCEVHTFPSAALNAQQSNKINGQDIGFFAGVSLVTSEDVVIGGLAVADYRTLVLDKSQKDALSLLAKQLLTKLEGVVENQLLKTKLAVLEEIEAQHRMLISALEKSTASVFIRNAKNEITWLNNAAKQHTGYSQEELNKQPSFELMVGEDTDLSTLNYAKRMREQHQACETENLYYKKDGTPVWLLLSDSPLVSASGILENNVVVGFDVTERKMAEKQLIAAHEEALSIGAEKENFLAVVSHEMRTPLNAVIGMSRLLAEEKPLKRQKENLDILQFSSDNLMRLINDMLDLTKIDSGKLQLESVPLTLETLIKKTVLSLQPKIKEKPIELLYDIDPGIPSEICGDYTRLYQILINLLGNSVKFTHLGYVRLKLSLLKEDDEHITIFFEVSDTGIGVAPERIDEIFGAFNQARADTSRNYGGTGLGLAITKKLVQLHNSEIKVMSAVGLGSTFSFPITFKKHLLSEHSTTMQAERTVQIFGKVLLVDDNAINRLLAKNILKKWKLQVDVAENGLEALNKVIENNYDLVLMDIHMPVMGGIMSVQRIRARNEQKYQLLPIIALTADALPGDEHKYRATGMNDYIAKPFDPIVFFNKISPFLNKTDLYQKSF